MIKFLLAYLFITVMVGLVERNLKAKLFNILVSIDQLLWVMITLGHGYPDETISSACYRYELRDKKIAEIFRPFIDWLFSWYETEHCYKAYLAEVNRDHSFKNYG